MQEESNAWSTYWERGELDSFSGDSENGDSALLASYWQTFAGTLAPDTHVADFATGNGTVPVAIFNKNKKLAITGIDYANIKPHPLLSPFIANRQFTCLANTDVTQLPVENNSYGAVTSQFGIEYADNEKASKELLRVLIPKGKFQLIIHSSDSEILKAAKVRKAELELINKPECLLDKFIAYESGAIDLPSLESFGHHFLAKYQKQLSPKVTGQVFTVINQVIEQKLASIKYTATSNASELLRRKLEAEISRLMQLERAAFSVSELDEYLKLFKSLGAKISYSEIITADNYKLAWLLEGSKGS